MKDVFDETSKIFENKNVYEKKKTFLISIKTVL